MKKYVLIVSETFPKTHQKAGQATNFPASIQHYDKIHTIRGNYALWEKRFKEIDAGRACLSIRIWEGKPYASKQQEIFRYDHRRNIGIEKLEFYKNEGAPNLKYPVVNIIATPDIETIAQNDGLTSADFKEWFRGYDLTGPLAIIHFTEFRYAKGY